MHYNDVSPVFPKYATKLRRKVERTDALSGVCRAKVNLNYVTSLHTRDFISTLNAMKSSSVTVC
jgi:hypothetical protein